MKRNMSMDKEVCSITIIKFEIFKNLQELPKRLSKSQSITLKIFKISVSRIEMLQRTFFIQQVRSVRLWSDKFGLEKVTTKNAWKSLQNDMVSHNCLYLENVYFQSNLQHSACVKMWHFKEGTSPRCNRAIIPVNRSWNDSSAPVRSVYRPNYLRLIANRIRSSLSTFLIIFVLVSVHWHWSNTIFLNHFALYFSTIPILLPPIHGGFNNGGVGQYK